MVDPGSLLIVTSHLKVSSKSTLDVSVFHQCFDKQCLFGVISDFCLGVQISNSFVFWVKLVHCYLYAVTSCSVGGSA